VNPSHNAPNLHGIVVDAWGGAESEAFMATEAAYLRIFPMIRKCPADCSGQSTAE